MQTVTIREIQHNLAAFMRKVENGEKIEIRRRNKVVARLVPAGRPAKRCAALNWAEVALWRRKLWGDKPAPGKPLSAIVYDSRGEH